MKFNIFNFFFLAFLIFNADLISCSQKMKQDKHSAYLEWSKNMKNYHSEYTKPHSEKMSLHQQISLLQQRNSIVNQAIRHHFENSDYIDHHEKETHFERLSLLQKNIDTLNSNLNAHYPDASQEHLDAFEARNNHIQQLKTLDDVNKKYANVPSLMQVMKANRIKVDYETGSQGADLGATCLSSMMESVPPSFCFKRGGDVGIIPTMCSCGTFRFLALCYENCPEGFYFLAGVCWENCGPGTTDIGLFCVKGIFDMYPKRSNIPVSYTNFHPQAICQMGYYKFGALCYRSCDKIGHVNCGIGACAASDEECASGIVSMLLEFIMSLVQFVSFVASFGTASAATGAFTAAKNALKSMGKKAANGMKMLKKIARNPSFRKKMIKETLGKAKDFAKDFAIEHVKGLVLEKLCEGVYQGIFKQAEDYDGISVELKDLDPTGVSQANEDCGEDMSDENNRIACAGAILGVVSSVDPTGLVGMAAAFMKPLCDV
jgi:hypothetical protein